MFASPRTPSGVEAENGLRRRTSRQASTNTSPSSLIEESILHPEEHIHDEPVTKQFHKKVEEYISFLELEHQAMRASLASNRFAAMEKEAEVEVLKHNLASARSKLDEVLRLCAEEDASLDVPTSSGSTSVRIPRFARHRGALGDFAAEKDELGGTLSELQAALDRHASVFDSGQGGEGGREAVVMSLYKSFSKLEFQVFAQHDQVSKQYDALLAEYLYMADQVKGIKEGLFRAAALASATEEARKEGGGFTFPRLDLEGPPTRGGLDHALNTTAAGIHRKLSLARVRREKMVRDQVRWR